MDDPLDRRGVGSLPGGHGLDWSRGSRRPGGASDAQQRLVFARDVDKGLSSRPRLLDCQYLYDARGSELFEEICRQPEYYLTRTEEAILSQHAQSIADHTGPVTVMELGAGTSRKTQHLLRAYCRSGSSPRYLAVDVSPSALSKGKESIERALPGVHFSPLCCTYEEAFPLLSRLDSTLVVLLGSTVGNFGDDIFRRFFERAGEHLSVGDYFLLGVDLHKDTPTLEAAYNDAAGVTAEFTRNLFARINRELGASIDLRAVEHRAHYNERDRQIEIFARFAAAQEIYLAPLGVWHRVEADEHIQTEISRKFTLDSLRPKLERLGFATRRVSTDARNRFAVLLLERIPSS